MRHKEELSQGRQLAQGGDIARSVCSAGRRPHGCPERHVWNGGCLSRDPEAGQGGASGWGPGSQGWVFGIDTEQKGGVQSCPGTTWGSKKTQLGPCPPACALWSLHGLWPPDIQGWDGDMGPTFEHCCRFRMAWA